MPIVLPRGYYLCTPVQRRDHPALNIFRDWLPEIARNEHAQRHPAPAIPGA